MVTMAAYLLQQGGQPVGSGQTALLASHIRQPSTGAGRAERPYQRVLRIKSAPSLRPAPSSHPEIKDALSVRRYECVAALRRFDSRPVSSTFGDLMADAGASWRVITGSPGVSIGIGACGPTADDSDGIEPESRLVLHLDARLS